MTNHIEMDEAWPKTYSKEIVRDFAKAVLHGDEKHRAWLVEAADCFISGKPLPKPT